MFVRGRPIAISVSAPVSVSVRTGHCLVSSPCYACSHECVTLMSEYSVLYRVWLWSAGCFNTTGARLNYCERSHTVCVHVSASNAAMIGFVRII